MDEPTIIWSRDLNVDDLNAICSGTLMESLGIRFVEIGPDFLVAEMPVDDRTVQPMGLLHGGASVALAESVGSAAAWGCVDPAVFSCAGLEINANHVRPVSEGRVRCTARPVHLGRSTQVWSFDVRTDRDDLVTTGRMTVAVRPIRPGRSGQKT